MIVMVIVIANICGVLPTCSTDTFPIQYSQEKSPRHFPHHPHFTDEELRLGELKSAV